MPSPLYVDILTPQTTARTCLRAFAASPSGFFDILAISHPYAALSAFLFIIPATFSSCPHPHGAWFHKPPSYPSPESPRQHMTHVPRRDFIRRFLQGDEVAPVNQPDTANQADEIPAASGAAAGAEAAVQPGLPSAAMSSEAVALRDAEPVDPVSAAIRTGPDRSALDPVGTERAADGSEVEQSSAVQGKEGLAGVALKAGGVVDSPASFGPEAAEAAAAQAAAVPARDAEYDGATPTSKVVGGLQETDRPAAITEEDNGLRAEVSCCVGDEVDRERKRWPAQCVVAMLRNCAHCRVSTTPRGLPCAKLVAESVWSVLLLSERSHLPATWPPTPVAFSLPPSRSRASLLPLLPSHLNGHSTFVTPRA